MKSTPRNHGAALVITLAMIAMLTFLIVAFLSRSVANLQIESASTGTARADVLAKSAGGIIVSDFKSEIIAGSTASGTASQPPVYYPTKPPAAVPAVAIHKPITGEDLLPFANLVKQSTGRFYPAPADDPYSVYNANVQPIIQTVTNVTTDIASQNGRSVINKRWDNASNTTVPSGPLLLLAGKGQSPTDTPSDSRFTNTAMLPHWVMMTRQGVPATQTWTTDWSNYAPTNSNAVIGRFAYNIYNTGGLLDANVAGYDETLASATSFITPVGQKGTVGLAKLSAIPGMSGVPTDGAAKFAKTWRNIASGNTSDNYLAYLGFSKNGANDLTGNQFFMAGPKTGFLKSAAGTTSADNRLLGRQDLIRLAIKTSATTAPYGLTISSLPYLTHFSREVNAPTWSPTFNAGAVGGSNGTAVAPAPAPYAYLDNKDNIFVPNRFLPNVRVAPGANWSRLTGEKAADGESLIKYRFPLSWLAVLQDKDPTTTDWELTDEATAIIIKLDARNIANGGLGLNDGKGTNADKAAWFVRRAFGLAWNKGEYRWDYTGSPTPANSTPSTVAQSIEVFGDGATSGTAICNESREPNFFELLKAGILSGSLGNASDYESLCQSIGEDSNPDYQVIQIGANIIDQADSDSYPTRIAFGFKIDSPEKSVLTPPTGTTGSNRLKHALDKNGADEIKVFFGVEDLPYMYSFLCTPYRIPAGEGNLHAGTDTPNIQNPRRDSIDGWLQFVMWKPQQQANSTAVPPKFRIVFTGSDIHFIYWGPDPNNYDPKDPPVRFPANGGVLYGAAYSEPKLTSQVSQPYVTFNDSPLDFRAPTLLGGMDTTSAHGFAASQPEGNGKNPNGNAQLPRGMWLGETLRPEKMTIASDTTNATAPPIKFIEFHCWEDSLLELQFLDGGNAWRTYQRYDRFGMGTGHYFRGRGLFGYTDNPVSTQGPQGSPVYDLSRSPNAYGYLDIAAVGISAVDPRTMRFGLLAHYLDYLAPSYYTPAMIPPTGTASPNQWKYFLKEGWAPKVGVPYNMLFGPSSSNSRFMPDWKTGATRQNPWQDHTKYDSPITDPTKFWADNAASTVTTMAYKDMDLLQRRGDGDSTDSVRLFQLANATTPNTQNLGRVLNRSFRSVGELSYVFRDEPYKSLNLFTSSSGDSALLDLFSVNEQPAIVAGKVNLNTQNPEVLQAVIMGAAREELSTTNTINASDALLMAKYLVANTATYTGASNTGPILNPAEIANRLVTMLPVTNVADQAIKTRREVVGRALAGSGQTRTWNLLVDVIAQSGRYASGATSASQFIVEGEKRYWMHVAIDRYTGQVIDQQLEPVME